MPRTKSTTFRTHHAMIWWGRVNRQLFWQQGNNFRMQVTPAWCRWADLTDIVLGLGELVFQKLRLWLRENFLQFYFTAEPMNFPTGTHVSHMGQASPLQTWWDLENVKITAKGRGEWNIMEDRPSWTKFWIFTGGGWGVGGCQTLFWWAAVPPLPAML